MLNRDEVNRRSKDTVLVLILIFLALNHFTNETIYIYLAIITTVLGMIYAKMFWPIGRVWFGFSTFLGTHVSKLLLSLLYFLMVVPVGCLRRALGFDSMKKKQWREGTDSVFTIREKTFGIEDIEKPY